MSEPIIIAIIGFCGSAFGSFLSLIVANKLMQYRIDKLEEAVKENSKLNHRVYDLERHNEVQDTIIHKLDEEQDRIIDDIKFLKRGVNNAT